MSDPVGQYSAVLDATLRGPGRAKERMLAEICDGLRDPAEPHRRAGADLPTAVERALGEFGRPHDLVPDCQRELTIRQTRDTAGRLAVSACLLLTCWHLLWRGNGTDVWRLTAIVLAAVTVLGVLEAAAALVLTGRLGRTLRTPPRLPAVTAWTATAASVAMLLATAALAIRDGGAAPGSVLLVAVAAVAGHALVAGAARACRRCWQLDRGAGSTRPTRQGV